MGTWSASIMGNDTAQDLCIDYTATFYKYDVETALKKIDEYVRTMFDENDEEEWCNYIYSLADFMYKKGILTDDVRNNAIELIDSGTGLDAWKCEGRKMLEKRKNVLEKLRAELLSPLPDKKRIRPKAYLEYIFENGDIVAIQLKTEGKDYCNGNEISQVEFNSYDKKYILIQKIYSEAHPISVLTPNLYDYNAIFRLFNGVYDEIPKDIDVSKLKDAGFKWGDKLYPYFICESSMYYFKRRNYKVITNDKTNIDKDAVTDKHYLIFGCDTKYINPDSYLISALDREKNKSE